jgi:hypothetical protein
MGTGLLTLAVLTAQVASSFVSEGASRARRAEAATPDAMLVALDRRLARIEELLSSAAAAASRPAAPSGQEPGGHRTGG